MANRFQDLVTRLIAKDDASKVIEHVSDDLDKLEKRKDVEIGLGVKDETGDDLRRIDQRLEGLSREDKQIVLRAQAKDAQRDIDRLVRSLATVDKMDDEEVKIRVEALGNAKAELAAIERQADELDREKITITATADTVGVRGAFASLRSQIAAAGGGLRGLATVGTDAFGGLGAAATAGASVAAAAIGTFVVKATTQFQTLALEVGKMRDSLGIPAEEASQLKEVVEDLGIPLDAFQAAVGRMNKTAEATPGVFDAIGAAVVRSDDGALDVTETFLGVATALDAIPDAGQRALAGAKIFGKGWTQIAELIEKGGLSIREAMEQVGAGKIVDDADIKNAKAMRDSIDGLRDRYEEFANTVGKDVGPIVTQLADSFGIAAGAFGAFIKVVSGDFDIPVLDKIARYGIPVIGEINAMADAWKGAKKEIDDFRGVTHGTVDPLMRAISGVGDLNTQLDDLTNKKDPLGQMTDQWAILMEDMRDGKIDTEAAATAANLLAGYLGITTDEVLGLADAELDKQMQDAAAAALEYQNRVTEIGTQVGEINQNLQAWRTSAQEAGVAMGEAMQPLEDGTAQVDAFKTSLDKIGRTKGLNILDEIGDRKSAMQTVFKTIKDNEGVIPDIFKTGSETARQFRDDLASLADTYNQDLTRTLEESEGNFRKVRQQARDLRSELREKVAISLGIDLEAATPEERKKIEALVNAVIPTDKEIELGIKLSKTALAKLKADLAIEQLKQLLPATALQLQVDLAEGEIGPREAAATAQEILNQNGVNVDLEVRTDKADQDLIDFAKEERNTKLGVVIPDTALQTAAGAIDAGPGGRGWPPIEVPVVPVLVQGPHGFGTGGVPLPTSVAPTGRFAAAPVAAAGMAPIRVPVSVAGNQRPVIINTTLQAAVIGAPFDVANAVDDANRRIARLLPKTS